MDNHSLRNNPRESSYVIDEALRLTNIPLGEFGSEHRTYTGINSLDELLKGLRSGSLTVIASRPLMGKEAVWKNIAAHVATNEKRPVLLFSMNHCAEVVTSDILGISPNTNIKQVSAIPTDIAISELASCSAGIFVVDEPTITLEELSTRVNKFKDAHAEIGLVIIDSIELMDYAGEHIDLSVVMRGLRKISKVCEVPVVVLSGLSREIEKRKSKRPILRDVKDISLFNYADVFMFVHWEWRYSGSSISKDVIELIVARNRHGSTGTVLADASKPESGLIIDIVKH